MVHRWLLSRVIHTKVVSCLALYRLTSYLLIPWKQLRQWNVRAVFVNFSRLVPIELNTKFRDGQQGKGAADGKPTMALTDKVCGDGDDDINVEGVTVGDGREVQNPFQPTPRNPNWWRAREWHTLWVCICVRTWSLRKVPFALSRAGPVDTDEGGLQKGMSWRIGTF